MKLDGALRWTGRIWAVVSVAVLAVFAFGGRETLQPSASQMVGVLLFPIGVAVGLVVGWWRQAVGGCVTVCSLALFYVWMFAQHGRLPPGPYFLLLAAPGFLFIAGALLQRIDRRPHGEPA